VVLIDSDVAAPRTGTQRLTLIARIALAGLWLVWAAVAWWSAPRPATFEQLDSDLTAGRVVSYNRGAGWGYQRLWAAPAKVRSDTPEVMLTWATTNGRTFFATPDFRVGMVYGPTSEMEKLVDRLEREGIGRGVEGPVTDVASALGVLMIVAALAVLIGGPPPVRGTRWFWFWVGQLPMGLGYLAWLALERPWAAPAQENVRRRNGWLGLGLMLVGGLVLNVLTVAASRLVGEWLIPVLI